MCSFLGVDIGKQTCFWDCCIFVHMCVAMCVCVPYFPKPGGLLSQSSVKDEVMFSLCFLLLSRGFW